MSHGSITIRRDSTTFRASEAGWYDENIKISENCLPLSSM